MRISDWSSDVCSSDLPFARGIVAGPFDQRPHRLCHMIRDDDLAVFPALRFLHHAPLFHCCFHVAHVGAYDAIPNPARARLSTGPRSLRCVIGTFLLPWTYAVSCGFRGKTSDLTHQKKIERAY